MLLAEVVRTSGEVAANSARSAKVAVLAGLLRRLEGPEEVEAAVAFLTGRPRQGKIGVGWATLRAVDRQPALVASLEVLEVDAAVTALAGCAGPRSAAARRSILGEVFERATEPEAEFVRRLLLGDLRQGALEGVMADALAKATAIPAPVVRRATMLAGDLPRVAALALAEGEASLAAVGLEVLRPVLPMLASTADDMASAIEAVGRSSVEWKLDGARVQAHRRGDEVRLFTRNLNDVTDRLPGVVEAVRSLELTDVSSTARCWASATTAPRRSRRR